MQFDNSFLIFFQRIDTLQEEQKATLTTLKVKVFIQFYFCFAKGNEKDAVPRKWV